MTNEEKQKKLAELRLQWKHATSEVDRKIIEKRANLIKRTIKTLL
jgi:hypothetical protein